MKIFNCIIYVLVILGCQPSKFSANNVKSMDATGNGKTDDTEMIQKALDKGGRVFLPAGTYKTRPLQFSSNTTIEGEGDKTIIQLFFDESPTTKTLQSVFYAKNIDKGLTENVTFKNLVIDGSRDDINWSRVSGDGNAHGIATWGTKNLHLENITIRNCWTDGLYVSGTRKAPRFSNSSDITVKNLQINNCGRQGISIISCGGGTFEDIKIDGVNRTSPRAGIDLEPNRFHPDKISNLHFRNIDIKNTGQGFIIAGVSRPQHIKVENLSIFNLSNTYGITIRNADFIDFKNVEVANPNGKSKYPLFFVANAQKVLLDSAKLSYAQGACAIEIQSGERSHLTEVELNKVEVVHSKNAGLFVKDEFPVLSLFNCTFANGGDGSPYYVLNINAPKTTLKNVKVLGEKHIGAVKLGADDVQFIDCEFEKGRSKLNFNYNGHTSKLERTKSGGQLLQKQ